MREILTCAPAFIGMNLDGAVVQAMQTVIMRYAAAM